MKISNPCLGLFELTSIPESLAHIVRLVQKGKTFFIWSRQAIVPAQAHEAETKTRDLRAIFAQGASDDLGDSLRHFVFQIGVCCRIGIVLMLNVLVGL